MSRATRPSPRRLSAASTTPQSALSEALLNTFWEHCHWTYELWVMRRELFDVNKRKRTLERGPHMFFLQALNKALTHQLMLNIAKLHDGAVVAGRVSLTLEFVVEYGGFRPSVQRRLARSKRSLDRLGSVLRVPRNRMIAHSDLAQALSETSLGGFKAGMDKQYFASLQRFVRTAFLGATGRPCADFSRGIGGDTRLVVEALARDSPPR